MPNPDGTVQVAPPTMSAFGPASASAPPPPMQAPPQVAPQQGGFMDAIAQLVKMLAGTLGPQAVTGRKGVMHQQEQKAEGLGNDFTPGQ